jgi:MFS transporter, DHA1 family, multidrug resistance protein
MISSSGVARPNATALTIDQHGDTAGNIAALRGLIQFAPGAIAALVTGLDQHSAILFRATMAAAASFASRCGGKS